MVIQWFPGHMNKAMRDIANLIPDIDIVIELLDARAPFSSCNPLLQEMIVNKKKIVVLNKSDLADDSITKKWIQYFQKNDNIFAIRGQKNDISQKNKLIKLCKTLAPHRNGFIKPLRVMIIGIPNVGKSTLINKFIGRKVAKIGDIPAVTKTIQSLTVSDDFLIYDTPGMMWHKIIYPQIGYNLAICHSIGKNALDYELLAIYLINFLKQNYKTALIQRYNLEENQLLLEANSILLSIAKLRGCILSGGRIDIQKASELIVQDFRDGKIGKLSLETPLLWDQWINEYKISNN